MTERRGFEQLAEIFHTVPLTQSTAVIDADGTALITHGTDETMNAERLLHMAAWFTVGCYQ